MPTPQTYKFMNETVNVAKTDPSAPNPYTGAGAVPITGSRGSEVGFASRYTTPPAPAPGALIQTPPEVGPSYVGTPAPSRPTVAPVDENAIREQTRTRMQSSIDAINANYVNLINQEKVAGTDRAGQTRSINARSGLMGSDFGAAQADKTDKVNAQQVKYLQDEQSAKISSVLANIEDRASAEIRARKDEALGQYERDSAEYQQAQEQARGDLSILAKSGADLDKLNPAQKAALLKQAGYDDPNYGELVYNAMKPKPAQIDYKFEKLADGRGMFYGTDPVTGELKRVDVNVDLPPDWQMQIAPDGTLIGYDKNTGEAKVLSGDGQFAKKEDPLDQELKRAQIEKIRTELVGGGDANKLLSLSDAEKLGVPYGTTQGQAAEMSITPGAAGSNPQSQAQAKSAIDQISNVLNSGGLNSVVGPNPFARMSIGNALTGKSANAIGDIQQITEQLSLDKLIQAKANGATFGALSERELQMLASSATKIGTWAIKDKNGKVTGYNASEKDFRTELNRIGNFAKQDYLLKGGNPAEIGAQSMNDGSVWTPNSNGEMVKLLDKLPANNGGSEGTNPKAPGGQPLSLSGKSVNTKTLASAVLPKYPEGSTGGQCVTFLHKLADFPPIGDGKNAKFASVDKFGIPKNQVPSQAKVGMILITDENKTYGHGAMINAISADGKYARVTESNYKGNETVSHDRVIALDSSNIYGAIQPKQLKSRIA